MQIKFRNFDPTVPVMLGLAFAFTTCFVSTSNCENSPSTAPKEEIKVDFRRHPNFNLLPTREVCGLSSGFAHRRLRRVVGGRISFPGVLPGITLIYSKSPLSFNDYIRGTGSLINSKYALTTASLLKGYELTVIDSVGFIGSGIADKKYNHPIESIIIHEGHVLGGVENDIALIRLEKPVIFNSTIVPTCLPIETHQFNVSELEESCSSPSQLVTAGYGHVSSKFPEIAWYPSYFETRIRLNEACNRVYSREIGYLNDNNICASSCLGDYTGLCSSTDIGAPLMMKGEKSNNNKETQLQYTLLGLVSKFEGCGRYALPGIYTNVARFLPWILDNIKP